MGNCADCIWGTELLKKCRESPSLNGLWAACPWRRGSPASLLRVLGAVEASARAEGRLPELMPWELAGFSSLMAISLLVRLSVCPVPVPQLGVGVNTHSYSGAELGTAPTMCSSALDLEMCCLLDHPPSFKQGLLLQLLGVPWARTLRPSDPSGFALAAESRLIQGQSPPRIR